MSWFHSVHWMLVAAAFLAIGQPVTSHPIQILDSIESGEFRGSTLRGLRNRFEKDGKTTASDPSPAHASSDPIPFNSNGDTVFIGSGPLGQHFAPNSLPEKSTVSILVPVSSASKQTHANDHHYTEEEELSEDLIIKPIATYAEKHYGEILGHPHANLEASHAQSTDYYSSSSLREASGHYISFFSYRISFPFLKYAPTSFPQFPLPGILMTVMILLGLVWVAIITIGLVEFGNYLWQRREETEENAFRLEDMKVPMQVDVGLASAYIGMEESRQDEDADFLTSESDSECELERDDYRIF